jgi:hypothetical protein
MWTRSPLGSPIGAAGVGRLDDVLEAAYTSLLVVIFALTAWFAVYVVYKLYQGQR